MENQYKKYEENTFDEGYDLHVQSDANPSQRQQEGGRDQNNPQQDQGEGRRRDNEIREPGRDRQDQNR